jgi:hypothetical protein
MVDPTLKICSSCRQRIFAFEAAHYGNGKWEHVCCVPHTSETWTAEARKSMQDPSYAPQAWEIHALCARVKRLEKVDTTCRLLMTALSGIAAGLFAANLLVWLQ